MVNTWYRRDFIVPIIHDDVRSNLTFPGITVQPHLPLRACQNGFAHFVGVNRSPSRNLASTVSVGATRWTGAHARGAGAPSFELSEYLGAVTHETRTFSHRPAVVGLLSHLALVARGAGNAPEPKNLLDARLHPGRGTVRVLVQEVAAALNLLSVEPAAEGQVETTCSDLLLDDRRVPDFVVHVLPAGKGCAHRRPDEEQRAFLRQQFLGALSTRWYREVPRDPLVVDRRQIQCNSRAQPVLLETTCNFRNSRRRVDLRDHGPSTSGAFSLILPTVVA